MSPCKPKYNLAIVGAGRQGMSILEALVPPRKEMNPCVWWEWRTSIRKLPASCTPTGIIFSSPSISLILLQLPDLDIIVNATGHPEVSRQLNEQRPERLVVLNVDRPYSWEDFWDLISMDLSSSRKLPP